MLRGRVAMRQIAGSYGELKVGRPRSINEGQLAGAARKTLESNPGARRAASTE